MSDKSVKVYKQKRSPGEKFVDSFQSVGVPSAGLTALMNLPSGVKSSAKVSAGILPVATGIGYFMQPDEKLVRRRKR